MINLIKFLKVTKYSGTSLIGKVKLGSFRKLDDASQPSESYQVYESSLHSSTFKVRKVPLNLKKKILTKFEIIKHLPAPRHQGLHVIVDDLDLVLNRSTNKTHYFLSRTATFDTNLN